MNLRRLTIALAGVLALWAGFAVRVSAPPDRSDYRRTAVQAAESAHDAAGTGALVARTQLDGHAFGTFIATAYDDAARTIAPTRLRFATDDHLRLLLQPRPKSSSEAKPSWCSSAPLPAADSIPTAA